MGPLAILQAGYYAYEGVKGVKYFFKAMQVFGVVSNWSVQAMLDGKVTGKEAYELISQLAPVLGIRMEWDLPADLPELPAE